MLPSHLPLLSRLFLPTTSIHVVTSEWISAFPNIHAGVWAVEEKYNVQPLHAEGVPRAQETTHGIGMYGATLPLWSRLPRAAFQTSLWASCNRRTVPLRCEAIIFSDEVAIPSACPLAPPCRSCTCQIRNSTRTCGAETEDSRPRLLRSPLVPRLAELLLRGRHCRYTLRAERAQAVPWTKPCRGLTTIFCVVCATEKPGLYPIRLLSNSRTPSAVAAAALDSERRKRTEVHSTVCLPPCYLRTSDFEYLDSIGRLSHERAPLHRPTSCRTGGRRLHRGPRRCALWVAVRNAKGSRAVSGVTERKRQREKERK